MRHVYIRGIMGLIWLAAAVITGLGGAFLFSAYTTWKKEQDKKGGR